MSRHHSCFLPHVEILSPEYFSSAVWVVMDPGCQRVQSIPVRICLKHVPTTPIVPCSLFPSLSDGPEGGSLDLHLTGYLIPVWQPNVVSLQCGAPKWRRQLCAWRCLASKNAPWPLKKEKEGGNAKKSRNVNKPILSHSSLGEFGSGSRSLWAHPAVLEGQFQGFANKSSQS